MPHSSLWLFMWVGKTKEGADLGTSEVATIGSGSSVARLHKVLHIFTPSAATIRDHDF